HGHPPALAGTGFWQGPAQAPFPPFDRLAPPGTEWHPTRPCQIPERHPIPEPHSTLLYLYPRHNRFREQMPNRLRRLYHRSSKSVFWRMAMKGWQSQNPMIPVIGATCLLAFGLMGVGRAQQAPLAQLLPPTATPPPPQPNPVAPLPLAPVQENVRSVPPP